MVNADHIPIDRPISYFAQAYSLDPEGGYEHLNFNYYKSKLI